MALTYSGNQWHPKAGDEVMLSVSLRRDESIGTLVRRSEIKRGAWVVETKSGRRFTLYKRQMRPNF